ncbi:thioredoxin domain-containing protein 6 isoform X2 [Prinia subflava]|uniref:thioredoxin domain-containing protein 6 isoform X2 n=1 Tax=Prinia subflava TaxID=208062 RepID=UPI002FE2E642
MAAKKKEVALQINITSQELWEELLCLKGLIVVDVFQAWCGPCKPVVNLFQKIRNEVGSDLLHFAVAEADSIDALEKYRGQWRRISGCGKRSRCTIAAEDHPETAGRGKEGFTWRRACGGARQSLLQRQGSTAHPQEEQREGLTVLHPGPVHTKSSAPECGNRSKILLALPEAP